MSTCVCGVCTMLSECRPAVPAARLLEPINIRPYNPQRNYLIDAADSVLESIWCGEDKRRLVK
jgi:hypothetical protein